MFHFIFLWRLFISPCFSLQISKHFLRNSKEVCLPLGLVKKKKRESVMHLPHRLQKNLVVSKYALKGTFRLARPTPRNFGNLFSQTSAFIKKENGAKKKEPQGSARQAKSQRKQTKRKRKASENKRKSNEKQANSNRKQTKSQQTKGGKT